jgi:hypothetical protein
MKPTRVLTAAAFLLFQASAVLSQQKETASAIPPTATEKPAAGVVEKPAAKPAVPGATDELSVDQARLADRYKRLEEVVGRLAELSAGSDPRRAKLLRDAIAQSREQDINVRFESIVKLLQDERLSAASTNQTELQKELDGLLTLLLKADREKELNSERERVKAYLKEVGRLIREQKGVRSRTENGDDLKGLGADQQRIANDTGKLDGTISKSSGDKKPSSESKNGKPSDSGGKESGDKDGQKDSLDKKSGDKSNNKKSDDKKRPGDDKSGKPPESKKPSESQPSGDSESQPKDGQPTDGQPGKPSKSQPSQGQPSQGQPGQPDDQNGDDQQQQQDPADRATDRLKKAQQQMQEAQKKLEEAKRKNAAQSQQQAIKELEQAKAELERVLRQLREEELERTLTQLAARFRKMLDMQTAVYDGTVRLDHVPPAERTHDYEIESARLSREESQIVREVDKALSLLLEEGSSVAFPEAVEEMRDDMRQVTELLAAIKVGAFTQDLEKDIIEVLEESISALDKSIKDLEKNRTPHGQQPPAGQPQEDSLVDELAELKMIRSMQMRINLRTRRYGKMIEGEQAETPELRKSLQELAERQQRVHKATADLQKETKD